MSEPQTTEDGVGARRRTPRWAWFVILGLAGAYAGWWGEGFFTWTPVAGLIAASIVGWTGGFFIDWLRRSAQVGAFPPAGLAIVIALGFVGGVIVGLMVWPAAAVVAFVVKGIEDDALRTAVGAGAGILLGALASWRGFGPKKAPHNPPAEEI